MRFELNLVTPNSRSVIEHIFMSNHIHHNISESNKTLTKLDLMMLSNRFQFINICGFTSFQMTIPYTVCLNAFHQKNKLKNDKNILIRKFLLTFLKVFYSRHEKHDFKKYFSNDKFLKNWRQISGGKTCLRTSESKFKSVFEKKLNFYF